MKKLVELVLLVVLLLAGSLAVIAGKPVRSGAFLIGDCPYYASTVISLLYDRDVDLGNQIRGGLAVHQKQVSLSRDGRIVPKHPILMPILAVPFYVAFGIAGFLVFNVLVMVLLGVVIWAMARMYVGPVAAIAATLLLLGGSFLWKYTYNFSPDLLSTLLALAGILLVLKKRPIAGGVLLGISILGKVTNVFVAATVFVFLLFRRPRTDAIRAALAMVPGVVAWVAINVAMFGGPTVTGYDRILVLRDGVPQLVSHKDDFDLPILEGIRGQLFHPRVGLLPTAPVILLAIPGFVAFLRRHPWDAALVLGIAELLFLLFSTYRWWATSHYGNRFLMLPVVLAAVPLAFTLQVAFDWLRARRGGNAAAPS